MALDSQPPKDDRISRIQSSIRVIPNFPKPGVMFQDITTMLLDPKAFKDTIDLFVERYRGKDISVVAGVEARGFIFGPPIALAIGAKFVPMRKPGKLPGGESVVVVACAAVIVVAALGGRAEAARMRLWQGVAVE
uniref:adenine phosphoribosyltransferase n=1 Tax=Chenopodium quinoa TaxID=63459 RepID=A0A803N1G3_CHEQI